MGLLSSIGKGIAKVLNTTTVALAHPIKTATAVISPKTTVKEVIQEHFAQPLSKQITQTVIGTAGIAATIAGGAAVGTAAKAGTLAPAAASAAKSLIPTTVKGKVIAAVAAPVVVGAIAKEPVKSIKAVVSAPSELAQFGGDVATFAANPSLQTAKEIIKESPIISSAVGAAVAGTAILKIAPAIATARQTEAIQEQTEAIKGVTAGTKETPIITPSYATSPQVAEVKTISPVSASKTRRKAPRKKEKAFGNINQRVNVIVSNKSSSVGISNKRYIKERILV